MQVAQALDLVGQTFGRLTVVQRGENDRFGKARWICRCECGNEKVINSRTLMSGDTRSCGCLRAEMLKSIATTHGESASRLYSIWEGMKGRCYYPKHQRYARYGGRGITVCDEWLDKFEQFRDWALSHGYRDDLSIDRIDNDGNYEPSNCRWATNDEQMSNTSRSLLITYNGQTMTASHWAEAVGISYTTLISRITELGWSMEKALTTPSTTVTDRLKSREVGVCVQKA
ncbi:MAG: hypothetical protein EOM14_10745 [Clostridia bacterium]|nr:hypothetical protein [Clostridia bacterium]